MAMRPRAALAWRSLVMADQHRRLTDGIMHGIPSAGVSLRPAPRGERQSRPVAVERSELRLVWPAALFAAEARVLLQAGADDDSLAGLLAEAFHGDRGQLLLEQTAAAHPQPVLTELGDSPWGGVAATVSRVAYPHRMTAQLVEELACDASSLPRHAPRPLYRQRQQPTGVVVLSIRQCKDRFAALIAELTALGYFEDAFGSECSDSDEDPGGQGQRQLAERLDLRDSPLWPLHTWSNGTFGPSGVHEAWPTEVFFDVVEALDELVARPRRRSWHSYHREWDYSDYSRPAGQAVYRWRVNDLLDRSQAPLRLAETGEDAGLLVHAAGDDRDRLVQLALAGQAGTDRDEVQHAVALFRSRTGTRQDKRSAVVALARLLEHRRRLIKAELLSKDEGALFDIANNFDLRHSNASQRPDYDDAYLDWLFWWYLATVELAGRLAARPAAP